jgi:hypothetical protein
MHVHLLSLGHDGLQLALLCGIHLGGLIFTREFCHQGRERLDLLCSCFGVHGQAGDGLGQRAKLRVQRRFLKAYIE